MDNKIVIDGKSQCREDMVQYVSDSISIFMEVDNSTELQNEVRKLTDNELIEKVKFSDELWEK